MRPRDSPPDAALEVSCGFAKLGRPLKSEMNRGQTTVVSGKPPENRGLTPVSGTAAKNLSARPQSYLRGSRPAAAAL
jgi:hypothetical protein